MCACGEFRGTRPPRRVGSRFHDPACTRLDNPVAVTRELRDQRLIVPPGAVAACETRRAFWQHRDRVRGTTTRTGENRRSEAMPIIAGAMQGVMTSGSVILGLALPARLAGNRQRCRTAISSRLRSVSTRGLLRSAVGTTEDRRRRSACLCPFSTATDWSRSVANSSSSSQSAEGGLSERLGLGAYGELCACIWRERPVGYLRARSCQEPE